MALLYVDGMVVRCLRVQIFWEFVVLCPCYFVFCLIVMQTLSSGAVEVASHYLGTCFSHYLGYVFETGFTYSFYALEVA